MRCYTVALPALIVRVFGRFGHCTCVEPFAAIKSTLQKTKFTGNVNFQASRRGADRAHLHPALVQLEPGGRMRSFHPAVLVLVTGCTASVTLYQCTPALQFTSIDRPPAEAGTALLLTSLTLRDI